MRSDRVSTCKQQEASRYPGRRPRGLSRRVGPTPRRGRSARMEQTKDCRLTTHHDHRTCRTSICPSGCDRPCHVPARPSRCATGRSSGKARGGAPPPCDIVGRRAALRGSRRGGRRSDGRRRRFGWPKRDASGGRSATLRVAEARRFGWPRRIAGRGSAGAENTALRPRGESPLRRWGTFRRALRVRRGPARALEVTWPSTCAGGHVAQHVRLRSRGAARAAQPGGSE